MKGREMAGGDTERQAGRSQNGGRGEKMAAGGDTKWQEGTRNGGKRGHEMAGGA